MQISSWSELSIAHLLVAFRKAKADCFFDRSTYAAEAFTTYEQNITANLSRLLAALQDGGVDTVILSNLGSPQVFGKRLGLEPNGLSDSAHHSFFSDAERAFDRLVTTAKLIPEFRLVGDFGVEMHIISALWINAVGHKYDARLRRNAYGSRVRRYGAENSTEERPRGDYQYDAIGIFDPYFRPYKSWRDNGIKAVTTALNDNRSVIAVTLDFSSYYHNIDPKFMTDARFLARIGLGLNSWEIQFTQSLVDGLAHWGTLASEMMNGGDLTSSPPGGLPIGLSAVRIITNVLLWELDEQIVTSLAPIYYGRYVDDIFLVMDDPGNIQGPQELWHYISGRASAFSPGKAADEVEVELPGGYQGGTRLVFQPAKQKVFFLRGKSGLDLLDSIAHQIRNLSSERRLMPLAEELDGTASARALSAADNASEEPDSLRRADGLTLRRLGWALQLRSVEILARDLERGSWTAERRRFYDFARAHILRPDKILEQIDYLARLISLAVSLSDWSEAIRLYRAATASLDRLEGIVDGGRSKINGQPIESTTTAVWGALRLWVVRSCRDAVLRSIPWEAEIAAPRKLTRDARRLLREVDMIATDEEIFDLATAMREMDWAKRPYKEYVRFEACRERLADPGDEWLEESFPYASDLRAFLDRTRDSDHHAGARRLSDRCDSITATEGRYSLFPYIFATRPYSAQEIALYLPQECVFGEPEPTAAAWGRYVRAIRGVWPHLEGVPEEEDNLTVRSDGEVDPNVAIIRGGSRQRLLLGISSLKTSSACWSIGASGPSDLSPRRYARLATIVNLAIRSEPRPTHLLLPELSLPERWLGTISAVLQEAGISLIAGLDYDHFPNNEISSSAVMVLSDDRLGYPASVQIRQPKLEPAPGEEETLHVSHGKSWRNWGPRSHPIYIHNGFHFGVLVCSELQNMTHRQRFQGHVDWLAVLSWNQDLETFSSLVESASLDVHAYVALVNNRSFGDSRVRAPRKEGFARDVCRIRGGLNEHLVVVEIEPSNLRAQQSRAHRWPRRTDHYKPAPEGFAISPGRRRTPS